MVHFDIRQRSIGKRCRLVLSLMTGPNTWSRCRSLLKSSNTLPPKWVHNAGRIYLRPTVIRKLALPDVCSPTLLSCESQLTMIIEWGQNLLYKQKYKTTNLTKPCLLRSCLIVGVLSSDVEKPQMSQMIAIVRSTPWGPSHGKDWFIGSSEGLQSLVWVGASSVIYQGYI